MEKRRIFPAFLVMCVIFAIVPRPGATAAGMSGLEVTGQTPMTQQTFTDLSVIGADSCGLTDAINGAKNPAQTIGEWIKGYWDSWLLRQQLTWGTVLNIAAAGARYTGNGDLLFNSQLSDLFTRFYNWLWDGEEGPKIIDYANSISPDTGFVTSDNSDNLNHPLYTYDIYYSSNATFVTRSNNTNVTSSFEGASYYVAYVRNNVLRLIALSDNSFALQQYFNGRPNGGAVGAYSVPTKNGLIYYVQTWNGINMNTLVSSSIGTSTILNADGNEFTLTSGNYADIAYLIYAIGDDQILGDPDKLGGLTGSERKRVAPPDIINFPDFGGNSGTIDVSDYLGGLRGAIESEDGTADVNITDSQGVESTETMTIDKASDIPAETETTAEAVNQGELISTATPSTELADYTIDLRNYFPFCIPWDLYDMITLLVAEPVAPHVQYPFVIEPLSVNYTIDLDFSQFDAVAAVLRTMELLAAGIGLALMTKRLIQGGD